MSRGFDAAPKKSLGQHFLHERGYVERIVHAVDPRPGDALVEIGPGQGAITFPLLDRHGALTALRSRTPRTGRYGLHVEPRRIRRAGNTIHGGILK